jgi:hypothetical protein
MKTNKIKIRWGSVIFFEIFNLLVLFLGFSLGLIYQQMLFTNEIIKVLSYSDVEVNVNFNATEFSEELNRTFIPTLQEALNQTIQEEIK